MGDSLDGFSRNHEKRSSSSPEPFLSPASERAGSRSLLSKFISVTSTVSPDIPPALKCLSARRAVGGSGLQARVTSAGACPSCRTGKSPNLRISSLRRDVVESVLFSDSTVRGYNVGIRESPSRLRFDIPPARPAVCPRKVADSGFDMPSMCSALQMTNSIDHETSCRRGTSTEGFGPSFIASRERCSTKCRVIFFYLH
ncbi:unnamed protein product [Lasius platythorax]|uniref:Uncharacterized protein n=1 Tax=Lasius platythorax TaxID=488582 RepID=A0AAV2N3D0_9HYME